MNSVLNKDFETESSLNSAQIIFSDVFHPASRMQGNYAGESGNRDHAALMIPEISYERVCASLEWRI